MFQLSFQEVTDLMLQNATSKLKRGRRRKPPRVFTEFGAVMAANVLNGKVAIDASILLVRVFLPGLPGLGHLEFWIHTGKLSRERCKGVLMSQ